ncbi:MAG: hypothetical protein MH204_06505, partial [Fimbriimonadaceae bacterium]|nr:hypothetical protein [Fimbriimonadaceae bacterium]
LPHFAPWQTEDSASPPIDILQLDGLLQFRAWRGMVFESWSRGQAPLWNSQSLMGTPLAANSQAAAWYPPHILFAFVPGSVESRMSWLAWLHLSWAGLGAWFLARRLGASDLGAILGGAAFALSPFLLAWLPLASVPTTVSWIPWCLAFTWSLFRSSKLSIWDGLGLAICSAMLILAGHLQFAFYGVLACLVLALVGVGRAESRAARFGSFILAGGAGAAVSAIHLLPVLAFSRIGHRAAAATQEGYEAFVKGAAAWYELPGLVFPSLLGFPGAASPEEGLPQAFWPAYVRPGAAFGESAWAVGPLVLTLALLLFLRRRWVAAGVAGLLAVTVLGGPTNLLLYFGIPGFSSTGSPSRILCLLVLGLCMAAALAWPSDTESGPEEKPTWVSFALVCLAPILVVAGIGGSLSSWVPDLAMGPLTSKGLVAGLPLALAAAALAGLCLWLLGRGDMRPWALGAGIGSQLLLGGSALVPFGEPDLPRATVEPGERLAVVNQGWGFFGGPGISLPPNLAPTLGFSETTGYDSLMAGSTFALTDRINGKGSGLEINGNLLILRPGLNLAELRASGASILIGRAQAFAGLETWPGFDAVQPTPLSPEDLPGLPNGLAAVEAAGPEDLIAYRLGPPALWPADASPVVMQPGRMIFAAPNPGVFEVKERNLPGWMALLDGRPVPLEQGEFLRVQVPEGVQELRFIYNPPGLGLGERITQISLMFLLFGGIAAYFRTQKMKNPAGSLGES